MTPIIVPPGQGKTLHAFGEVVRVLLDGERTGGKFSMWMETTPPGGGPPPHYHTMEDEWFHVLEGRVSFLVEGQWREVEAGASAYMPKNSVHTFKNVGDQPLKMLIHSAPSGFEKFFARCADEFARPEGPDMKRVVEISAEHGIYFVS